MLYSPIPFRNVFLLIILMMGQQILFAQSAYKTYIIKYEDRSHSSPRDKISFPNTANRISSIPELSIEVWESQTGELIIDTSQYAMYGIEWVEEDQIYSSQFIPNDASFVKQWNLRYNGQHAGETDASIRASEVWDTHRGSKDVTIAHLDSGVDWSHPDLVDNIWQNLAEDADQDGSVLHWDGNKWIFDPDDIDGIDADSNGYIDDFIGWDFVNNDNNPYDDHHFGHGTHVAGIMAARGNNDIGIAGVSWFASIMPLKFLDENGQGSTSNVLAALAYAKMMKADLSQNSWGGGNYSQALFEAIEQMDIPFVAAAGNHYGNRNDLNPLFPASYVLPEVISVSASDYNDKLAAFSNVGRSSVDLFAPGLGIYSTLPNQSYGFLSGTSMAAPHVSGALALWMVEHPTWELFQIKNQLLKAVDQSSAYLGTCVSQGRLNLNKLLYVPQSFQLNFPTIEVEQMAFGKRPEDAMVFSKSGELIWHKENLADNSANSLRKLGNDSILGLSIAAISEEQTWLLESLAQGSFLHALDDASGMIWSKEIEGIRGRDLMKTKEGEVFLMASKENKDKLQDILITKLNTSGELLSSHIIETGLEEILHVDWYRRQGGFMLAVAGMQEGEEKLWFLSWQDEGIIAWQKEISLVGLGQINSLAVFPEKNREDDEWLLLLMEEQVDQSILYLSEFFDDGSLKKSEQLSFPNLKAPFTLEKSEGRAFLLGGKYVLNNEDGYWLGTIGRHEQLLWQSFYPGIQKAIVQKSNLGNAYELLATNQQGFPAFIGVDALGKNACSLSPFLTLDQREGQGLQLIPTNMVSREEVVATGLVEVNWEEYLIETEEDCSSMPCEISALIHADEVQTCRDGILSFESITTNASSYQWIVDSEVVSNGKQLNYQFEDKGKVWIELIASNDQCSDKAGLEIEVRDGPDLQLSDTAICASRLEIDLLEPTWSYKWLDKDTEAIISSGSKAVIDYTGKFEVEVEDACGNKDTDAFEVNLTGDCVWPGDINGDGNVNTTDFLLLGLANGTKGPVRPEASLDFFAQEGPDWSTAFGPDLDQANGRNLKHADSDGNGQVEIESDKIAIQLNARESFSGPNNPVLENLEIFLAAEETEALIGDSIHFEIVLQGAGSTDIQDVYGLSFQLNYNLPLQNPPQLRNSSSWFSNDGTAVSSIHIPNLSRGNLEVGLVRTDQTGISGAGPVMRGGLIILIEDIGILGSLSEEAFLTISLDAPRLLFQNGSMVDIGTNSIQNSLSFRIKLVEDPISSKPGTMKRGPLLRTFVDYPNEQIKIWASPAHFVPAQIELFDFQGRLIAKRAWSPDQASPFTFPMGSLATGLYLLKVYDSGKKWLKSHRIVIVK